MTFVGDLVVERAIMSYNNIGLSTVRGSGTNGYVQRNFALVRHKRDEPQRTTDEGLLRAERALHRKPNAEILAHDRKRAIELECAKMQDAMEEQGYASVMARELGCLEAGEAGLRQDTGLHLNPRMVPACPPPCSYTDDDIEAKVAQLREQLTSELVAKEEQLA